MSYYIGTDIGGTFTDLVMLSDDGDVTIVKSPTTPSDRTQGVLNALDSAAQQIGIPREGLIGNLKYFAHGTTAATNAFIERKGVKTGLLITRGFADTLRIQRCMASWAGLADHEIAHFSQRRIPVPIIPLDLIEEIAERVDENGDVIAPLDEDAARESVRRLAAKGVEAVAITLLWSFRNPAHEKRLAEIVREEAPRMFVTVSSSLIPILGEYERASTTSINSYLGPVIHRYIKGLEKSIRGYGYRRPDLDHGIRRRRAAGRRKPRSRRPILLTSGPAGGVLASQKLGEQIGYRNIMTTDMGGTSFDVGLIVDGQPILETTREVGRFHVALPSIKVTAIGAGGGSIARVDRRPSHRRAGKRRVGAGAGLLSAAAARTRRSRTPTSFSASSILPISLADR